MHTHHIGKECNISYGASISAVTMLLISSHTSTFIKTYSTNDSLLGVLTSKYTSTAVINEAKKIDGDSILLSVAEFINDPYSFFTNSSTYSEDTNTKVEVAEPNLIGNIN